MATSEKKLSLEITDTAVEHVKQFGQILFRGVHSDLDTDRIPDATQVFDMRAIGGGGAVAGPKKVRAGVEVAFFKIAGERFFIRKQQRLV